ncbi:MAG: hypothetical protein ACTTKL_07795 [Treponema sp.]
MTEIVDYRAKNIRGVGRARKTIKTQCITSGKPQNVIGGIIFARGKNAHAAEKRSANEKNCIHFRLKTQSACSNATGNAPERLKLSKNFAQYASVSFRFAATNTAQRNAPALRPSGGKAGSEFSAHSYITHLANTNGESNGAQSPYAALNAEEKRTHFANAFTGGAENAAPNARAVYIRSAGHAAIPMRRALSENNIPLRF